MPLKKLEQSAAIFYIAEQRLWINDAGDALVEEGDPTAAILFCTPGKKIKAEDAKKFGLVAAPKAKQPTKKAKEDSDG
jgi:hypothetical protein